jgi:HprK-related kinase A
MSPETLARRLSTEGVSLQIGGFAVGLRIDALRNARQIADLYRHYPIGPAGVLTDFDVEIKAPNLLRRFYRPQVQFYLDHELTFTPQSRLMAVPIVESAINWGVLSRTARYLLLHAAVAERSGNAVILPGDSGAGKSTLCAALVAHGYRLLSDEFTMIRLDDGQLQPFPRPISLKNESIDVIARRLPGATFSKRYEGTAKGTIAFLRAPIDAVERALETARPRLVVAPNFQAGAKLKLETTQRAQAFMNLTKQSPNYFTLLKTGFETLSRLVETCEHYKLTYSDVDAALDTIDSLFDEPHPNARAA